MTTHELVLGGGCFWCLEAALKTIKGVTRVLPGYAGGEKANPTYEEVCTGETGHAEVVKIIYDPKTVSLKDLLKIFFAIHDPTTLNRQGNDIGSQYRSVMFYQNEEEKKVMEKFLRFPEVVTQLIPLEKFWEAEEYHHNYFAKNPDQPYCQLVISPKLAKLRAEFSTFLAP